MSHQEIKELLLRQAKEAGISATDAKVLSIDPYFVGSPKDIEMGTWAAQQWDAMMAKRKKPLHLRGFHYYLMSKGVVKPDGVKYAHEDPVKDWTWLLLAAQMARYLGIGEWKGLADLKHPDPSDYDNYWVGYGLERDGTVDVQAQLQSELDGLVDRLVNNVIKQCPNYYIEGYQTYHLEVWIEKQSMGIFIEPVVKKYGAVYQPLVGQASVEKVNMAFARCMRAAEAGKKVRIFYISDWDRYGAWMPAATARKLEFYVDTQPKQLDIKLAWLALTEDQINQFNLPKAPKHGEKVVELDALEALRPGALGKIVEKALVEYFDFDNPKIVIEENNRIKERARALVEEKLRLPLEASLGDLKVEGVEELNLQETLDSNFVTPEPGYEVDDSGENWILNTNLEYWEQWKVYRKFKAEGRQEEEV